MPGAPTSPAGPLSEMVTRSPARSARRNKTRLIGFDTSEGSVVDLFGDEEEDSAKALAEIPAAPTAPAVTFPVGWVLVTQGPGRGHAFPLSSGMSSIGRGEDQTVRLDFGDAAISRSGHAAIVYDADARSFLLGQGGKSNIVRLNGKPVISNETLRDGDDIKIGETVLRLKTLCGPDFDWADTDSEEDDDDVAIA
ncbi:FHA domain-containing protein [Jannaschia formosa]|nr:FHA domain-containing protein [Jannaschia formosa]